MNWSMLGIIIIGLSAFCIGIYRSNSPETFWLLIFAIILVIGLALLSLL